MWGCNIWLEGQPEDKVNSRRRGYRLSRDGMWQHIVALRRWLLLSGGMCGFGEPPPLVTGGGIAADREPPTQEPSEVGRRTIVDELPHTGMMDWRTTTTRRSSTRARQIDSSEGLRCILVLCGGLLWVVRIGVMCYAILCYATLRYAIGYCALVCCAQLCCAVAACCGVVWCGGNSCAHGTGGPRPSTHEHPGVRGQAQLLQGQHSRHHGFHVSPVGPWRRDTELGKQIGRHRECAGVVARPSPAALRARARAREATR